MAISRAAGGGLRNVAGRRGLFPLGKKKEKNWKKENAIGTLALYLEFVCRVLIYTQALRAFFHHVHYLFSRKGPIYLILSLFFFLYAGNIS